MQPRGISVRAEWVCQLLWHLQSLLVIKGGFGVCWYECVFVCVFERVHWSYADLRALMWNLCNPSAHCVFCWGMMAFFSLEWFIWVYSNMKQYTVGDWLTDWVENIWPCLFWWNQLIINIPSKKKKTSLSLIMSRLPLMDCFIIYMLRWVIGCWILMQSYACLKGFTDYGSKPLASPQNDQFMLEWLLLLLSLEIFRLNCWFRLRKKKIGKALHRTRPALCQSFPPRLD